MHCPNVVGSYLIYLFLKPIISKNIKLYTAEIVYNDVQGTKENMS